MSDHRNSLQALFGWFFVAFAFSACAVPGVQDAASHFALDGAHREIGCSDCHGTSLAVAVPLDCKGCHLKDRPNPHDKADCGDCHNTTGWDGASIDHQQYLSLKGGHAGVPCSECHLPGTYKGLDAACESCHEGDRPNGHFGGPCGDCHSPSGWDDAEFDHSGFFPIPHRGVSSCDSCHPAPEGTASFSCTGCHTKSRTDGNHRGNSRYRWESQACLDCHPNGRGD